MFVLLTRAQYDQRLQAAVEGVIEDSRAARRELLETVQQVAEAEISRVRRFAAESIQHAEARAERAEASLSKERQQFIRDMRHVMSMFLRREKTLPLPPTREEKEEAKVEAEEARNTPPLLSDVEIAMRDANRRDAAAHGLSTEEADRDFMQTVLKRMAHVPD